MDFGLSTTALILPAFIAGILTFLAPCTLPFLPAYLAFISGVSVDELKDPARAHLARKKVFFNGLWYVVGFSLVFIALGSIFGAAGTFLSSYRLVLMRFGGVVVMILGLVMLGVIRLQWLTAERRLYLTGALTPGRPSSSLLFGATFAFGWTPCVGPILGSVLLLASQTATVGRGALLLTIFALGLAIPFLIVAAAFGSAAKYLQRWGHALQILQYIGGALLVILGILLITNNFNVWLAYAYRLFSFINYDKILNFL